MTYNHYKHIVQKYFKEQMSEQMKRYTGWCICSKSNKLSDYFKQTEGTVQTLNILPKIHEIHD